MEIFTLAMMILFGAKALSDIIDLGDVPRHERREALYAITLEALFSPWAAIVLFKE